MVPGSRASPLGGLGGWVSQHGPPSPTTARCATAHWARRRLAGRPSGSGRAPTRGPRPSGRQHTSVTQLIDVVRRLQLALSGMEGGGGGGQKLVALPALSWSIPGRAGSAKHWQEWGCGQIFLRGRSQTWLNMGGGTRQQGRGKGELPPLSCLPPATTTLVTPPQSQPCAHWQDSDTSVTSWIHPLEIALKVWLKQTSEWTAACGEVWKMIWWTRCKGNLGFSIFKSKTEF